MRKGMFLSLAAATLAMGAAVTAPMPVECRPALKPPRPRKPKNVVKQRDKNKAARKARKRR